MMQKTNQTPPLSVTDQTPFPYGKAYKGTAMANVPAWFLLSQYDHKLLTGAYATYVEENKDALEAERKRASRFLSK